MSIFEKTFKNYQDIYTSVLDSFYPSLGSTGFQERNLTVNFSKAYEQACKLEDVYSWFELQFGEKKNNHFDCVIINAVRKEIFIVESKRFTSPSKKDSVLKDIKRIQNFVNSGLDERFIDFKGFSVVGVILADVWMENNQKIEIYKQFKSETFFNNLPISGSWHMYDARTIGVKTIIAPMIETPYAMKKYVAATKPPKSQILPPPTLISNALRIAPCAVNHSQIFSAFSKLLASSPSSNSYDGNSKGYATLALRITNTCLAS